MKTGVIVILSAKADIEQEFLKIRSFGFDNCQLVSWDLSLRTDEMADKIKAAMEKTGVSISAFWCGWRGPKIWDFYGGQETLGLVPVTWRYPRIEDLMTGADFAHKLGVENVVSHMGYLPENPYDPNYQPVVIALRTVAQHCLKNGQNLLMETGQETPVAMLRVIEDVGTGNLFVNLDPANLILYGKGNPVDALDVFGKYVRGVHAKDGLYPTNGRQLGHETALGDGKVNFPALVEGLHRVGYDGPLTIEREIEGDQQTADILKAKALLEECIAKL